MTTQPMEYEKKWGALQGDEIIHEAETKEALLEILRQEGKNPEEFELVGLPKTNRNLFV